MHTAWALAMKDLRMLVRDRTAMFFTFVFPVLFAAFFGMIFSGGGGGGSGLAIAVVDRDGSRESRAFVERLSGGGDLVVTAAADVDAARGLVLAGKRLAYVAVPAGYGEGQRSLFTGTPPAIEVGIDPSRKAEAGMLQGILMKHGFMGLSDVFSDPARAREQVRRAREAIAGAEGDGAARGGVNRGLFEAMLAQVDRFLADAAERRAAAGSGGAAGAAAGTGFNFQPVRFDVRDVVVARTGPTNAFAVSFPQGIIWGVMGAASGFGVSLVTERNAGTLARLRLAPISRGRILLGKALACLVTIVAVVTGLLLVAVMVPVFAVRPTSVLMLGAAVVSTAVCFVGLMMLLATIGRSERGAGGIGWAIMMVLGMMGGAAVPLFVMPAWMQTASHVSPMKWAILALEGGLWRGFGPERMLLPCGILVAVGVAGFALGARLFSWES